MIKVNRCYNVVKSGEITEIALNGPIGFEFDIPFSELSNSKILRIDMHKVNLISSEGTRLFVKWLWEIERALPKLQVKLGRVSPMVTRQFNTVKGHMTDNVEVTSVYVPFFCENCDIEDLSVLVTAVELRATGELSEFAPDPVICPKCKKPMELDCDAEKYFSILVRPPAVQ